MSAATMLRELTKADWQAILKMPDELVPHTLLLRGTRNLKRQFDFHRPFFDDVIEIGLPNGVIEDVFVGRLAGQPVAYASVYGAPMTSEIVHIFGVLGTKLVVQTGCCGALADEIGPGDLVLATEAYCGEGAAQYYKQDGMVVRPSSTLRGYGHNWTAQTNGVTLQGCSRPPLCLRKVSGRLSSGSAMGGEPWTWRRRLHWPSPSTSAWTASPLRL